MRHSLIEINFKILLLKKPLLVVLRIKKSLSSRQRLSYLEPHSRNRQRKRVKGGRGLSLRRANEKARLAPRRLSHSNIYELRR